MGIFAEVNECIFSKFLSFLVGFRGFSSPKSQIMMVFPKFASFCVWKCSNFVLWVSFLAGVLNWNKCVKFHSLLLLERCEIHVKKAYIIYVLWAILRCVIDAFSNLVHAGEIRSESALAIIAFYRV